MAIAKAKRRVEEGKDVCVVLDGITRLARAYNLETAQSGKTLPGGVEGYAAAQPM